MAMQVVHVADVEPARWKNGGGVTRQLLTWPNAAHWALRVSVADVEAAGPFSIFTGVDRWFGVLHGDGVKLQTVGAPAAVMLRARDPLHMFPGDRPTHCFLIDGPTRDVNIMAKRDEVSTRVSSLASTPALSTRAALIGCFVSTATTLHMGTDAPLNVPAMSLAWTANPNAQLLELACATPVPRGWWIEADPRAAAASN